MSERYVLIHHGIKGMRWGVRRFQNEDGSLTAAGERRYSGGVHGMIARRRNVYNKLSDETEVWEKGTITKRVTSDAKKDASKGGFTYVSKGDDYKNYRDLGFGNQLMMRPAKEALLSPSEKERVDIFIEMANDRRMSEVLSRELANKRLVLKSEKRARRDVSDLANGIVSRSRHGELSDLLYGSSEIRDDYFKRVASRGYNAIADDSDRLVGMGKTSLIVLNQDKSLGEVKVKDLYA